MRAAPWTLSLAIHAAVLAALAGLYLFTAAEKPQPLAASAVSLARPRAARQRPPSNLPEPTLPRPIDRAAAPTALAPPAAPAARPLELPSLRTPPPVLDLKATSDESDAPTSRFFSAEVAGRKIVYVVDWSGSLISGGTYDLVLAELLRSIRDLRADQRFHVICFSTGKPREMQPPKLAPATDAAKLRAWRFIRAAEPASRTEPMAALERAFAVLDANDAKDPGGVIYLLTDGYLDVDELAAGIDRLDAGRSTSVNIILHQDQKPAVIDRLSRLTAAHAGTLSTINAP